MIHVRSSGICPSWQAWQGNALQVGWVAVVLVIAIACFWKELFISSLDVSHEAWERLLEDIGITWNTTWLTVGKQISWRCYCSCFSLQPCFLIPLLRSRPSPTYHSSLFSSFNYQLLGSHVSSPVDESIILLDIPECNGASKCSPTAQHLKQKLKKK